jgi:hypothetical protein
MLHFGKEMGQGPNKPSPILKKPYIGIGLKYKVTWVEKEEDYKLRRKWYKCFLRVMGSNF